MSPTDSRAVRFVLAGGANTLFGFAVFSAGVLAGAPASVALVLSTVAGVAFNFLTFGAYAFRNLSWRRLPRFLAAYVACYALNVAALEALRAVVASAVGRQALLTPPMALVSWLLLSRFVLRTPSTRPTSRPASPAPARPSSPSRDRSP